MEDIKTEKKITKSVAHERIVKCYPPPKYHTLLVGYLELNEMKKSEGTTEIIKHFFDNMDAKKKQLCLNVGIRVSKGKHHY
jgi:hypothetical protein